MTIDCGDYARHPCDRVLLNTHCSYDGAAAGTGSGGREAGAAQEGRVTPRRLGPANGNPAHDGTIDLNSLKP